MQHKPRIAAVVPVRMTSTRLPGKVMKEIEGKPMLEHIVDRLRASRNLDNIVLAIAEGQGADQLTEFARDKSIDFFCGSEHDVLSRCLGAGRKFGLDTLVRITSDCPFADPGIVDRVISEHCENGAEFTANYFFPMSVGLTRGKSVDFQDVKEQTYPRGLDVDMFSIRALEIADREMADENARQHVMTYFWRRPDLFKTHLVHADGILRRPELNLCVDTPGDLEFVQCIYRKLYDEGEVFSGQKVIELLDAEPEILDIKKSCARTNEK